HASSRTISSIAVDSCNRNLDHCIQYALIDQPGPPMRLDRNITVVGAHAEGEVGRVITGGVLPPRGATMFEQMMTLRRESGWLRDLLLFDPRGSVNAAINLITPPVSPDADLGMIVMESMYFPPMSGSNLMCTVTVALETGMITMREPLTTVRVDTPAGLVDVTAECSGGRCKRVTFRNVPSFVMHRDRNIEVAGLGTLRVDVAYGGMIYCLIDAIDAGFSLARDEARDHVLIGERVKSAAAEQLPAVHPENPDIHTINQVEFTGIVDTGRVGGIVAVVPEIGGRAWLTGVSHYGVDPDDPFPTGYRLADTWFA